MKNFLVYFYNVDGHGPDSVETPLIGKPREERAKLQAAIAAKYPKCKPAEIHKIGSIIESRDDSDPGYITVYAGQTIHQILGDLQTRRIGRVWFSGAPYDIHLAYNRGAGSIVVHLYPRIKQGASPVKFSNQISPQTPATELEKIVRGVLGQDIRDFSLLTRPVGPATVPISLPARTKLAPAPAAAKK